MNPILCFNINQILSDFMDGQLPPADQKNCQSHLDSCQNCSERLVRLKKLITSLAALPKISLPPGLKNSPMNSQPVRAEAGGPRPGPNDKTGGKGNWMKSPWYIRSGIEGIGITIAVLLIVGIVPRLRTWYETSLEKRLEGFNLADFISSQFETEENAENSEHKMAKGKAMTGAGSGNPELVDGQAADEFSGEEEEEESKPVKGRKDRPIRVGSSEVLRFSISSDQPVEFRLKVMQLLKDLGVPSDTKGIGGIKAPGGIQFDLIVSSSITQQLQKQLQKLAGTTPKTPTKAGVTETGTREAFTWYKVRSRRNIPAGKTRVVIWLSQY